MAIELMSVRAVPASGGERVFRVAWLGRVVATAILAAGAFGIFAVMFEAPSGIPRIVTGWCGAWVGLFALVFGNDLRKALRVDAWIVVVAQHGLYVKWRSYQNVATNPDDPAVACVAYANVAHAHNMTREWIMPSSDDGPEARKRRFVELILKDADTTELARQLEYDRAGRTPDGHKKSSLWRHHPVSLEPGNVLRIEWDAREPIDALLDELRGRAVRIGDEVESTANLVETASNAEVGELARRGDVFGLVKVLRATQGLDLTTAHTKARELVAGERSD